MEKDRQPRILPSENIFRHETEIKTFSDEERLREFVARRPALKVLLKEVLQTLEVQEETWGIRNGGRATEMVNVMYI